MRREALTTRALLTTVAVLTGSPTAAGAQERGNEDARDVPPHVEAVAGLWGGTIEVDGQRSGLNLRFVPAGGDSVDVLLSMPAIGAFDLPAGRGVAGSDGVTLGPWTAQLGPDGRTIHGAVPAGVMPAHPTDFTLTRAQELEPTGFERLDGAVLEPAWVVDVGAPVWAGLVAVDRGVVAGSDDGAVRRFADDGALMWTRQLGGPVRATPTLLGDRVLVSSDDGALTALDLASGAVAWTTSIEGGATRVPPGEPGSRYDHYGSSVAVVDGIGFVGRYGGGVTALSLEDGGVVWSVDEASSVLGTPAYDSERIYYGTFDGDVVARDRTSGDEAWRIATGGAVTGAVAIEDGIVVAGNRAYDVLGFDALDGSQLWEHYYWWSWVESSPVIVDGVVYIGSSDGQRLFGLDLQTGEPRWSDWVEGSAWAAPVVTSDEVFVGTVGVVDYLTQQQARLFRVDRRTGDARGRFDLERPGDAPRWGFASAPAVGPGHVFAATIDGRLYAFVR